MKTTRLLLSIILVALATVSFGQRSYRMERLSPDHRQQVAHFTADRHAENSRIEIWTHNPHGRASKKVSYDISEAPVVASDFYFEQVEILYEENLQIESWMTTPFKSSVVEEELNIESWMTTPFNTNIDEDRLKVESWMTTPFEADEFIEMESWMSAFWI